MTGVYTNLAKKRVEQTKEAIKPPIASNITQLPSQHMPEEVRGNKGISHSPTPSRAKKKNAKDGKHQISGWIPMQTFEEFVVLHRRINPVIEKVEKQYMLSLAIDIICKILGQDVPVFQSPEKFKAYLEAKLKDKF